MTNRNSAGRPAAGRPAGQMAGLLIVGSLVLAGVSYQYLTKPVMSQVAAARTEADTTERKLESQRLLVAQLPQLQQENRDLEAKLVKIRAEFPSNEQLGRRLDEIESVAEQLGLKLGGFQRTVEESGIQGVDRLKLSTAILGSYSDLTSLMKTVRQDDRFTTIEGLELGMSSEGLTTKMDIYSYMLRPVPVATPDPNAVPEGEVPGDNVIKGGSS